MDISSIVKQLGRARFNRRVQKKIKDPFWSGEIRRLSVDPTFITYEPAERSLQIADLGVKLFKPEHSFFLKALVFARGLKDAAGGRFRNVEDLIVADIGTLSFEIRTFEELYILHEIFVDGVYNIKLPRSVVVIDVGANVGFSSVLFAQNSNVSRVIAYEPLATTYQHALRNLALNVPSSSKIDLKNFGLSNKTEAIEIEFSDEIKGSVGIRGLGHRDDIDRSLIRLEKLEVLDAGTEIKRVIDECEGSPVVLKIDCEGSEYRIIDSIISAGQLTRVASIMMEWHDPQLLSDLENKLTNAGFTVFSLSPNSKDVGMMYAGRNVDSSR